MPDADAAPVLPDDVASLKAMVKKAEELADIAPPNAERLPALGPQNYPKVNDFDERTATARSPEMIPHVKTVVDAAMKQKLVAGARVLLSQTPFHDPTHEPLPEFAGRWFDHYDNGGNVVRWYGS